MSQHVSQWMAIWLVNCSFHLILFSLVFFLSETMTFSLKTRKPGYNLDSAAQKPQNPNFFGVGYRSRKRIYLLQTKICYAPFSCITLVD